MTTTITSFVAYAARWQMLIAQSANARVSRRRKLTVSSSMKPKLFIGVNAPVANINLTKTHNKGEKHEQ